MYKLTSFQNGPTEDVGSYEIIMDVKVFDTYVIQELIAVFSERRYSRLSKGVPWGSWYRTDLASIDVNTLTTINNPSSFNFDSNLDTPEIYVCVCMCVSTTSTLHRTLVSRKTSSLRIRVYIVLSSAIRQHGYRTLCPLRLETSGFE